MSNYLLPSPHRPQFGAAISASRDSALMNENDTSRTAESCARLTPILPVADHSTTLPFGAFSIVVENELELPPLH